MVTFLMNHEPCRQIHSSYKLWYGTFLLAGFKTSSQIAIMGQYSRSFKPTHTTPKSRPFCTLGAASFSLKVVVARPTAQVMAAM